MTDVADMLTGIVLAGGQAPGFANVDRMLQDYRGKPLFHHPLNVLTGICDDVVVQARPGGDPPLPDSPVPIRVSHDPDQGGGPVVALLAALRITWTPLAVVVGGDMPDIAPRVLLGMIRVMRGSSTTQAVVLEEAGSAQPLPCIVRVADVRAAAIEMLRPSAGDPPKLKHVLASLQTVAISDAEWKELDPFGTTLRGIDRPEDLKH